MKVELLYLDGCPGYADLHERLPRILQQVGVVAEIDEHCVESQQAAQRERFLGSPTVRIDGCDVDRTAAGRDSYGLQCRLYDTQIGLIKTPPDTWVVEALQKGLRLG